jgi:hypothetical protein
VGAQFAPILAQNELWHPAIDNAESASQTPQIPGEGDEGLLHQLDWGHAPWINAERRMTAAAAAVQVSAHVGNEVGGKRAELAPELKLSVLAKVVSAVLAAGDPLAAVEAGPRTAAAVLAVRTSFTVVGSAIAVVSATTATTLVVVRAMVRMVAATMPTPVVASVVSLVSTLEVSATRHPLKVSSSTLKVLGRSSPNSYQNFIRILLPMSITCLFST